VTQRPMLRAQCRENGWGYRLGCNGALGNGYMGIKIGHVLHDIT